MKRDLDLVREILIKAEELSGEGVKPVDQINFSTDSDEKLGYHLHLLIEEGLVTGSARKGGHITFKPLNLSGLTWKGHEFLDNIRNDTVWEKIKSKAKEQLSSVSFQVLASLAEDFAKDSI